MGPANTPLRLGRAQGWGYMCSVADKPRSGTCHGAPSILPSAASLCLSVSLTSMCAPSGQGLCFVHTECPSRNSVWCRLKSSNKIQDAQLSVNFGSTTKHFLVYVSTTA